jgi:hypothetical protein
MPETEGRWNDPAEWYWSQEMKNPGARKESSEQGRAWEPSH